MRWTVFFYLSPLLLHPYWQPWISPDLVMFSPAIWPLQTVQSWFDCHRQVFLFHQVHIIVAFNSLACHQFRHKTPWSEANIVLSFPNQRQLWCFPSRPTCITGTTITPSAALWHFYSCPGCLSECRLLPVSFCFPQGLFSSVSVTIGAALWTKHRSL